MGFHKPLKVHVPQDQVKKAVSLGQCGNHQVETILPDQTKTNHEKQTSTVDPTKNLNFACQCLGKAKVKDIFSQMAVFHVHLSIPKCSMYGLTPHTTQM